MINNKNIISYIKSHVNIVNIIEKHVKLKKFNNYYQGKCPFHDETNDSFTVYPSTGKFKCFGCGKAGDVIDFVELIENLNTYDAIHKIAMDNNIKIEESESYKRKKRASTTNTKINKIYITNIEKTNVLNYLIKRGLNKESIKKWGIGFSDGNIQKGIIDDIEITGNLIKKDNYVYDMMKDRIVFPIYSDDGLLVGFSGRSLSDDKSIPKYINSRETENFKKSELLFGLNITKTHILQKNRAIVMEGYMDVIYSYQEGLTNVVGVMGTAFTDKQALKLLKYTNRLILMFDGDDAGRKAALRSCSILLKYAFKEIKILILPDNQDPMEFIKSYSIDDMFFVLHDFSVDIGDFIINTLSEKYDKNNILSYQNIISDIALLLKETRNWMIIHNIVMKYCYNLNIPIETGIEIAKKALKKSKRINSLPPHIDNETYIKENYYNQNDTKKESQDLLCKIKTRLLSYENILIYIIVSSFYDCDFIRETLFKYNIVGLCFNKSNKEIIRLIKDFIKKTNNYTFRNFVEFLTPEKKDIVLEIYYNPDFQHIISDINNIFTDSLLHLKIGRRLYNLFSYNKKHDNRLNSKIDNKYANRYDTFIELKEKTIKKYIRKYKNIYDDIML